MYFGEYRSIGIYLLLNNGLGGDHLEGFLGPLIDPVELSLLGNCWVEEYALLEVMDHGIKEQYDVEVVVEVVEEQFNCVLFVDCLVGFNQLILKEVGELLVVRLGVNLRQVRCLEKRIQLLLLGLFFELVVLNEEDGRKLV